MNQKNRTSITGYWMLGLVILLCSFQQSFAQDNATITLLRPKQSMMSGGSAFTIHVYVNDTRIDDLANGVVINYSLFSEGDVTLKLQKEGMGSLHGAPQTVNLKVEKGGSYIYFVEAGMNDLKVEEYDQKKAEKLTSKAKNFDATLNLKEDPENPVIK